MVDKEHVDVLLMLGLRGPSGLEVNPGNAFYPLGWFVPGEYGEEDLYVKLDYTNADEVGAMLVATNLASIHARYPDTIADPEGIPGPIVQYWNEPYTWTDPRCRVTAVEGLKAISCYEYQSCEHEGWKRSEARQFCEVLTGYLVGKVNGYNEAPWAFSAEHVAARRGVHV